ncbi:MAG TPA: hypothetical protein PLL10_05070, partial [Elusimicrobiales bacterium]|nr:hypothetical protein [Elusimicrobiales bacterium]
AELIAVENCKKATGRSCVAYTGEKMSGANEWNGKAVATAFVLPWTLDEFQKTYSAKGSVSFATQTFGNVVDSWADLETDKRLTNIARLGAMKIAEVKAVSDCYKAGNKVCIPGKARQISDDGFTYVVSVTALGMWSFPPAGK